MKFQELNFNQKSKKLTFPQLFIKLVYSYSWQFFNQFISVKVVSIMDRQTSNQLYFENMFNYIELIKLNAILLMFHTESIFFLKFYY
jgi:hypothetical protein